MGFSGPFIESSRLWLSCELDRGFRSVSKMFQGVSQGFPRILMSSTGFPVIFKEVSGRFSRFRVFSVSFKTVLEAFSGI